MIRNIVFDIGNVLVAFRWKDYFADFGYDNETLERLAKATVLSEKWNEYDKGVLSEKEIWDEFIKNDPELKPVILNCLSRITGLLKMYDYTIPWIKELQEKGYKVYYLSNMSSFACRDCGEDLAFLSLTDGGILSWEEKVIKPDPAIYQLLLERYNLKPEECVFLDDTEKNVISARNMGMQSIVFQNKEQACMELRKLGVDA